MKLRSQENIYLIGKEESLNCGSSQSEWTLGMVSGYQEPEPRFVARHPVRAKYLQVCKLFFLQKALGWQQQHCQRACLYYTVTGSNTHQIRLCILTRSLSDLQACKNLRTTGKSTMGACFIS